MTDDLRRVIDNERKREALTPKQSAFVREMLSDPSSATAAAIRAGYSKISAKYSARQLLNNEVIKSILAQHFIDKEQEVSDLLSLALIQLRGMVEGDVDDIVRLNAINVTLRYAKMAKDVLGLRVDRKPELPAERMDVPEEEILASIEAEATRLRTSIARRSKTEPVGDGPEALH